MERNEFLGKINSIIEKVEKAQRYKTVYSVNSAMTDLECAVMQLNTINELLNCAFYDEVINRLFKAYVSVCSAVSYSKVYKLKTASTLLMQAAKELEKLIIDFSYFLKKKS